MKKIFSVPANKAVFLVYVPCSGNNSHAVFPAKTLTNLEHFEIVSINGMECQNKPIISSKAWFSLHFRRFEQVRQKCFVWSPFFCLNL